MEKDFEVYDIVILNRDIPGKGLVKGMRGTILMVYDEPDLPLSYEIEFVDQANQFAAVETIEKNYIMLISNS